MSDKGNIINLNKKEVHLVYDKLSVSIDEIINAIEMAGYMVIQYINYRKQYKFNFAFKKKSMYDKIVMLLISNGEVFFNGIRNQ